jgi:hypothetical protein
VVSATVSVARAGSVAGAAAGRRTGAARGDGFERAVTRVKARTVRAALVGSSSSLPEHASAVARTEDAAPRKSGERRGRAAGRTGTLDPYFLVARPDHFSEITGLARLFVRPAPAHDQGERRQIGGDVAELPRIEIGQIVEARFDVGKEGRGIFTTTTA